MGCSLCININKIELITLYSVQNPYVNVFSQIIFISDLKEKQFDSQNNHFEFENVEAVFIMI